MTRYKRSAADAFAEKLALPRVHILFGARQTGKSTLILGCLPSDALIFNLADPSERARFSERPGDLIALCRSLPLRDVPWFVFIDEAQLVPELFNAVQVLFDEDPGRWRFILCGSSARKLRATGANFLPGRSILHSLQALTNPEYQRIAPIGIPVDALMAEGSLLPPLCGEKARGEFPFRDLEDRLLFGDLPGIATIVLPEERREVLISYVTAHLEEEIRRETAIRDYGIFLRFLRCAAAESGGILNLQALSRESGLSAPTIRAHYQLLEDMFLGYMIPAFSGSPRKAALSSPRFLFFDLGIRNAAARLHLDMDTVRANPGPLFEQWVGGEIYKRLRYKGSGTLSYFRTSAGAEVDFIIEDEGLIHPIEVKWTERPTLTDAKHMLAFMKDHPDRARRGYIVCRCPYPLELSESVSAIPWWGL
jgi:predicted AAA+ superfamily ATPase